ncbi:hypothetical protein BCIN_15g04290 [Botrytis cinerea B05.10]|uniref:Uncharacterized protein n=1 Tax=Botryotinia fuckeliana (strain B05.10) TaxID=332648 RepID=A0A384K514_BOTFB|nr:hypothetical protein BCIN_15g04290 [Botrytis cinerea B05.10]
MDEFGPNYRNTIRRIVSCVPDVQKA